MSRDDSHLKMTKDDLRAARVLTLAVKFFGSSKPVSSSSIYNDLYSDLDIPSFNRQFLRDRDLLASLGMQIRSIEGNGETLWQVDEQASYVQGEGLGSDDAHILYVLCYDMSFDQSFPYRDELRLALAKISRMYGGSSIALRDTSSAAEHKLLSALVSCMSMHHAARVNYVDANGRASERVIALLGSFGLRDKTYFVASRIAKDGSLVPDSVRIYRLDRFTKVTELPSLSYQVPLDFSVSDYERLPFQIGDNCGTARFLVPDQANKQVRHAVAIQGSIDKNSAQDDQGTVWEVPYSNVQAAASWAVGLGVVPLAPADLVQTYHRTLAATAAVDAYDGSLSENTLEPRVTSPRKSAGRTGSIAVTRQLVALASSLTREGEVITAQDIATSLGVDYDAARHLIALVSLGSGESIDYLPVILSDNDDEVSLMEGAHMSARRVRLTKSETIALVAALEELGVKQEDALVKTLVNSYATPLFSLDDIKRSLETPSSVSDGKVLRQCSQAIAQNKGLTFSYVPITEGRASRRRVVPHLLRRSDDCWYLDAFDLVRRADRCFRIDRMSYLESFDLTPQDTQNRTSTDVPTNVLVLFGDPSYIDLFYWEGMQVLETSERGCLVRMPYYGGSWLAQHLAACAGTVRVNNRQLADKIRQVAMQEE